MAVLTSIPSGAGIEPLVQQREPGPSGCVRDVVPLGAGEGDLHVCRARPLGGFFHVKLYRLAFRQRVKALSREGGPMEEHLGAILSENKAEAPIPHESLNRTCCHSVVSSADLCPALVVLFQFGRVGGSDAATRCPRRRRAPCPTRQRLLARRRTARMFPCRRPGERLTIVLPDQDGGQHFDRPRV